ncbi:hypothetical protein RWK44_16720 [Rhizobium sp. 25PS6]|nr:MULTISPECIES: hypothetical protein [Rhizobium]MBY3234593.1 hypothetical protein [Rhizobium laguerreae]MBY3378367.1 hypothetical protein [Rhizobium laguerreae]MDU0362044.1 hypothetical protein [Rhizobium sp. 25PS6]
MDIMIGWSQEKAWTALASKIENNGGNRRKQTTTLFSPDTAYSHCTFTPRFIAAILAEGPAISAFRSAI